MSFLVAVDQRLRPESIEATLAAVEADFATSRSQHPGRCRTRVFLGMADRCRLLAIGEWEQASDYHRLYQSARYQDLVVQADPPARIEPLRRLRFFARMSSRPAVIACAIMTMPEWSADAFRAHMLAVAPSGIERTAGLVSHEVFQVGASPGALLAIHGWRSLADLERFRTEDGPVHARDVERMGVTMERFTGVLAADYSRVEVMPYGLPPELQAVAGG